MTTHHRLRLPYTAPPDALRGNSRGGHWGARTRDSAQVRSDVAWLAHAARVPRCDHLTVELTWAPGDRRHRDEDNLWPLLKACCDALARGRADWTGLELVPSDTPAYMTKKSPRILGPDECAETGLWLDITAEHASDNQGERRCS